MPQSTEFVISTEDLKGNVIEWLMTRSGYQQNTRFGSFGSCEFDFRTSSGLYGQCKRNDEQHFEYSIWDEHLDRLKSASDEAILRMNFDEVKRIFPLNNWWKWTPKLVRTATHVRMFLVEISMCIFAARLFTKEQDRKLNTQLRYVRRNSDEQLQRLPHKEESFITSLRYTISDSLLNEAFLLS